MSAPEPFACAMLIVAVFCAAGVLHVLWMRSPLSRALALPLDGGRRWRGRPLLGAHKTLRGFVAMVPATGAAFAALGMLREALPAWLAAGLWPLGTLELLWLGLWCGFWFMAGELPNSFLKRRLGIAPGAVPAGGAMRLAVLAIDRLDSILAMLLALSLVVPVAPATWAIVLLLGPGIHLAFSGLLYGARLKSRFA